MKPKKIINLFNTPQELFDGIEEMLKGLKDPDIDKKRTLYIKNIPISFEDIGVFIKHLHFTRQKSRNKALLCLFEKLHKTRQDLPASPNTPEEVAKDIEFHMNYKDNEQLAKST